MIVGDATPSQANPAIVRNPLSELAGALKENMEKVFAFIAEAGKNLLHLKNIFKHLKRDSLESTWFQNLGVAITAYSVS